MNRIELAKSAFYGMNEKLMKFILSLNSYEEDGIYYPANSIDLSGCINTLLKVSDELLKEYI